MIEWKSAISRANVDYTLSKCENLLITELRNRKGDSFELQKLNEGGYWELVGYFPTKEAAILAVDQMSDELKKCPLCNGEVKWCDCSPAGECHLIVCEKCGTNFDCTVDDTTADTMQELLEIAREKFNVRAND